MNSTQNNYEHADWGDVMNKNTTLVITRIIAVSVLLYAVVDIIFFVKWLWGHENGHINLGVPLTIAIGVGILFLQDWARKLYIYLGLVAVAFGLISAFVPGHILSSIFFYSVQISVDFANWQLVLIAVVLTAEVVFLLLPWTTRLFKPNKQPDEEAAETEEQ